MDIIVCFKLSQRLAFNIYIYIGTGTITFVYILFVYRCDFANVKLQFKNYIDMYNILCFNGFRMTLCNILSEII